MSTDGGRLPERSRNVRVSSRIACCDVVMLYRLHIARDCPQNRRQTSGAVTLTWRPHTDYVRTCPHRIPTAFPRPNLRRPPAQPQPQAVGPKSEQVRRRHIQQAAMRGSRLHPRRGRTSRVKAGCRGRWMHSQIAPFFFLCLEFAKTSFGEYVGIDSVGEFGLILCFQEAARF